MSKKDESGIKKGVLESIQELSELDSAYFQKGAVNVLKLLYEQDVTMTNITAERLDKIESRLATLTDLCWEYISLLYNTCKRKVSAIVC